MELICPSCEARYQLPPGAIPKEGRQVACQACGHTWHALPEIALGPASTEASPSKGLTWQGPGGRPTAATAAPAPLPEHLANEPDWAAGEVDETPKGTGQQTEQLSQIRQMLEEMQTEERGGAPASHASRAQFTDPSVDVEEEVEPDYSQREMDDSEAAFRERLGRLGGKSGASKPVDVHRIRRSHDRRVSRKKHAKEAGSGMFRTGFLLIVIIAAVMVSLYVLHPRIIAKMPGTEAAMVQYVTAIDSMRASLNQTFGGTIAWVRKRLDDNFDEEQQ